MALANLAPFCLKLICKRKIKMSSGKFNPSLVLYCVRVSTTHFKHLGTEDGHYNGRRLGAD